MNSFSLIASTYIYGEEPPKNLGEHLHIEFAEKLGIHQYRESVAFYSQSNLTRPLWSMTIPPGFPEMSEPPFYYFGEVVTLDRRRLDNLIRNFDGRTEVSNLHFEISVGSLIYAAYRPHHISID